MGSTRTRRRPRGGIARCKRATFAAPPRRLARGQPLGCTSTHRNAPRPSTKADMRGTYRYFIPRVGVIRDFSRPEVRVSFVVRRGWTEGRPTLIRHCEKSSDYCGDAQRSPQSAPILRPLTLPFRPDPRSMAAPRWSLQRGWHELGAQVVVISSLSVMTGCYHLVRINVVCYDRAPIPILGLDAAAGGGQSGVGRLSPKWPTESEHEPIVINRP